MQYLLTAGLYPATSMVMTLHFVNRYGNSLRGAEYIPSRGAGCISPQGTFWFFEAVTILGGSWVWLSIPVTAGRPPETMDRLFALPWYNVGMRRRKSRPGLETGGGGCRRR